MQLPSDLAERLSGRLTISVAEAAELLHLSLPTMYAAIRRGQVPVLEFGERAKRVPVGALLTLCGFEENKEGAEVSRLPLAQPTPTPLPILPFPNARKAQSDEFTPTG